MQPAIPEPSTDSHPAFSLPVELELGDGSRLVLEDASASPIISRVDGSGRGRITLDDVMRKRSQPFAGYRLHRD